jgi:dihydroorotate dehydrogenase
VSAAVQTYRIDRSYDWNYAHGPSFPGRLPRVPRTPDKTFLGHPVRSRVGIAAGLLLNSRWIRLYSRLGFDILTYKTVRGRARRCHPMPNWVWIDRDAPLQVSRPDEVVRSTPRRPFDPALVTSAVSFGMPSRDPAIWTADVRRARRMLRPGQVLVVSVVASPEDGQDATAMVEDFARLAALAADAGAHTVEANLSCPNVSSAEGTVYLDPALSGRVARAMRHAAGRTPVALKAGHFGDARVLERFLREVAGHAAAVVLVNGITRRIVDRRGRPAFGRGREHAGILGHAIHQASVANVRAAKAIIERERLGLEVVAVGGVLSAGDAADYFEAGAHAVLAGAAPMFDPYLAVTFKEAHPEW